MFLSVEFLPYVGPLLRVHEQVGQQPDNLCGPYWVSLLLRAYGEISVSPVEVAIAASTVVPSQGDPSEWLPAGESSRLGAGYEKFRTVPDVDTSGTSIDGLIRATEQLSQGRFCLVPLQANHWIEGIKAVWDLCQTYPDWQMVPILNVHTSYFWGSHLTPLQCLTYLQTGQLSPPPADWSVGHFVSLVGQLQASLHCLYALLDTYPRFGWNGLHLQPPEAIAQSLDRPHQPTQGGLALFVPTEARSQLVPLLKKDNLQITPWNNGSPTNPDSITP